MTKWATRLSLLADKGMVDALKEHLALIPEATMGAIVHTLKRMGKVGGIVDVSAEPVEDVVGAEVEQADEVAA